MTNPLHDKEKQFKDLKLELSKSLILGFILTKAEEDYVAIQYSGWELVLAKDGRWFVSDTTGG